MYRLLLLFSLLGCAVAVHNGQCSWLSGKTPFNAEKFSGDWYLVAGTPLATKLPLCGKFHYHAEGNNAGFTYSWKNEKGEKVETLLKARGYKEFSTETGSSSSMGAWKTPSGKWIGMYDVTITASDYENFAVVSMCKDTFDEKTETFGRQQLVSILGRRSTLGEETLKVLKALISGYDVDIHRIQAADHTNCI